MFKNIFFACMLIIIGFALLASAIEIWKWIH